MSSQGPNRPRTPRVGERYVVPAWIRDRAAWHEAMDEVEEYLALSDLERDLDDWARQIATVFGIPAHLLKGTTGSYSCEAARMEAYLQEYYRGRGRPW